MSRDKHPLLHALEAFLASSAPAASWRPDEVIGIGVATPLEPQWLIARRHGMSIVTSVGCDAPVAPRALLVLDADNADLMLERSPASVPEVHVMGDAEFLSSVLSSSLLSGSLIDARLRGARS